MPPLTTISSAKRAAAHRAVADHFDPSSHYIGIGSGTTIIHVVDAIRAALLAQPNPALRLVATGSQSRAAIAGAGLAAAVVGLDEVPAGLLLDACFDGADEVDGELNAIKGGGACLFQEKLVAERSRKFVCVADWRKAQASLLTAWPCVPVEVAPLAVVVVLEALRALGSREPRVRVAVAGESAPARTDQGFLIVDAPFPRLLTRREAEGLGLGPEGVDGEGRWEVDELSRRIKAITGVLEVGIFCGMNGVEAQAKGLAKGGQKPVACYFGMEDGSVSVREAAS